MPEESDKNLYRSEQDKQYADTDLLSVVEPIQNSRNEILRNQGDLEKFIEYPLLQACKQLYEKNIKTFVTSANKKDVGKGAYIIVDYANLSETNKTIAEKLGKVIDHDGSIALEITIPVDDKTTVGDVRKRAEEIVSEFQSQVKITNESSRPSDVLDSDFVQPEWPHDAREPLGPEIYLHRITRVEEELKTGRINIDKALEMLYAAERDIGWEQGREELSLDELNKYYESYEAIASKISELQILRNKPPK